MAAPRRRAPAAASVVFDPGTGDVFTLNHAGALVWRLHAAGVPADGIARRLARRYRIDRERARRDVYAFLAQVHRHGLTGLA